MDLTDLRSHLSGNIGLPGEEVYSIGRTVWYPEARTREPLASIQPASAEDVAKVLRWARKENIRVSPRSGGHSFDGFPVQPDTVLLDFSQMNEAHLRADGVLIAQPGARIISLAKVLSPYERALPTGDCGTVALGGLLAGGGFGYASRVFGLTIDNVEGATLVTGEGEILEVDRDRNADLFWACRGGGGAAAIVTEFKIRSFPVQQVTAISMHFAWESALEVLLAYDKILSTAPRGLDLKFKIRSTGKDRFLDSSSEGPDGCVPGTPTVEIMGQFLGSQSQAEPLLAPLFELTGRRDLTLSEEGYFDAMLDLLPLPTLNEPAPSSLRPLRVASDFIRGRIDRVSAQAIVNFAHETQYSEALWGGCVLIEPSDGAVNEIGAADTAFPHRDSRLLLQWEIVHPLHQTDAEIAELDSFLQQTRQKIAPLFTGGRYINYADRLDTPSNWWGSNRERLKSIASHFDPDQCILSRLSVAGEI
jgi:FAD binding domain-containing protein